MIMARSRELWLGAAASLLLASGAFGGVAGALDAARRGYQLWTGAPMAGTMPLVWLVWFVCGRRFVTGGSRSLLVGLAAGGVGWSGGRRQSSAGWIARSSRRWCRR